LDSFVKVYNNTIHKGINDKPKNIYNKKEKPIIYLSPEGEIVENKVSGI
jgi:hypothetical protein